MALNIFDLSKLKTYSLIHDVVIYPLKVNRDPRGILVEIMKITWPQIYDKKNLPFNQTYYSITESGVARDENLWHFHPGGQQDRFGVIKGEIVVAVLDNRKESPTKGILNLFHLGELKKDKGQYLVLVPRRCLHGFVVVSRQPAILFNFPSRLYDPKEELRITFSEARLKDGSVFSWNKIRRKFGLALVKK